MDPTAPIESLADMDARICCLETDENVNTPTTHGLSSYEDTFMASTAFICRNPGDKFTQLQKILLKHIFSESDVRSLFASDVYVFLARLVHPEYRKPMCQLVINLCKIAPPEVMVRGAALVNRLKDPEVNFGNPKYKDILVFD